MKISVIAPVLNEVQFIGYSIMAAEPYVHEFVYALDDATSDGTKELLFYIKNKYLFERLKIWKTPTFHPSDMLAYNEAFNTCIEQSTGDACWFLHPDMIVTKGPTLPDALAWWTNVTSYAKDFKTVITKGRCDKWKNIHAKKFGLHYFGGYGSQNEDFYHSGITGTTHRHFGTAFSEYPFMVKDSKISVNHYCELKPYKRRLEKMKLCLKTLVPNGTEDLIDEMAINHPRVTLEKSSAQFGNFEFTETENPIPDVFEKYKEFESFKNTKEVVNA